MSNLDTSLSLLCLPALCLAGIAVVIVAVMAMGSRWSRREERQG